MKTGFFWDERCFWHGGGAYSGMLPTGGPMGGLVQPGAGLPESPESKRRLLNLMHVTGLAQELTLTSADPATPDDLARVHHTRYLSEFQRLSEGPGGELGPRAPFSTGGYDIASLSAGLAKAAVLSVLRGHFHNAYALSRPPGHHCTADQPQGFCLLANIAISVRAAQTAGLATRVAILDWDVHHGNGTEAIFADDPDVLTVSLHQDRNFPLDTGQFDTAARANLNIPLPPGTGHAGYLAAMERLALPALRAHRPDVLIIACGYDAALNDPLGRMLATAETFRAMTAQVMALADDICGGKLVMVHEGGYSETYVPFCGHAVLSEMAGSVRTAPDPLAATFDARQPGPAFDAFLDTWISGMEQALG